MDDVLFKQSIWFYDSLPYTQKRETEHVLEFTQARGKKRTQSSTGLVLVKWSGCGAPH